jgi:hypothetical protein
MTDSLGAELYKSAKDSREQMHNTSDYDDSFARKQAYEALVQGFIEVINTFSEPYDHSQSDDYFSDSEIYEALLEAFKRETAWRKKQLGLIFSVRDRCLGQHPNKLFEDIDLSLD